MAAPWGGNGRALHGARSRLRFASRGCLDRRSAGGARVSGSRLARGSGELLDERGARAQVELAVDAAQVEVDRLGAEEQGRADLPVGLALGGLERDLQLLRRQLLAVARLAAPEPLAGGAKLGRRALCPRPRAEPIEFVVRGAQLAACVDPAAGATQPLAEAQLGAREPELVVPGMQSERVAERLLERVVGRQQPAAARGKRIARGGERALVSRVRVVAPPASQLG